MQFKKIQENEKVPVKEPHIVIDGDNAILFENGIARKVFAKMHITNSEEDIPEYITDKSGRKWKLENYIAMLNEIKRIKEYSESPLNHPLIGLFRD